MVQDTEGTVAAWQAVRDEVINTTVSDHSGRIVKLTGDGFLAEFPTDHEAVICGIAMQQGFADSSLDYRIGINLGDIIDDGQDIHGEGVNLAARLEGLAEPGGICISGSVHEQVYDPQPPFDSGSPKTADPALIELMLTQRAELRVNRSCMN